MNSPKKFSICFTIFALALLASANVYPAAGELYVTALDAGVIYKFTSTGARTAFASGLPSAGPLAFNKAGNLFVNANMGGLSLIKITPDGTKSTFAADIFARGMAFDAAGNLFVSDNSSQSILKFTPAGAKSTFAPAVSAGSLAFDSGGNLYAVDLATAGGKIYKFTPAGAKSTFATGLTDVAAIAINAADVVYAGDRGGTITKFTPAGAATTFATNLGEIRSLGFNSYGDLFVGDASLNRVVRIAHNGTKTVLGASGGFPAGIAFEPARGLPLNLATRMQVQTGDNVLIGGFIITGPAEGGRFIVLRGIGPSLAAAGIGGALPDPIIELHYPNGMVGANDNWRDGGSPDTIQEIGLAPGSDLESAMLERLKPGNYTVVLKGRNNTTGVGLIELYDVTPENNPAVRLANVSTRGLVGTGENVMIGGFILNGNGGKVVVRAIGPSLTGAGIANALSDTVLSLRDGNGAEVAGNDDWKTTQLAEIQASGLAPANNRESAILMTLPSGNYTAIVSGYQGATGVALFEAYNLP